MILMHFLRALSELGLYYALAGTAAARFGGSLALAGLLVLSACFALSAVLQKRGWGRWLAVLPAAGFFFLPGGHTADWAAYLPGLAYLVWMVWKEDYALSWSRQADIFSMLWKACPPFGLVFALFCGVDGVVGQGLPAFLLAAAASVLLLRSIRHGPEVYCQGSYQLLSGLSLAALLAAAWLASTDWFLDRVEDAYTYLIAPLLTALSMLVGLAAMLLFLPLQFLAHQQREVAVPPGEGTQLVEAEERMWEASVQWESLLPLLGVLAAGVALFFFFRWMTRRRAEQRWTGGEAASRHAVEAAPRRVPQALPYTYAGRIRGQYRQFLKHCRRRGIELEPADTSTEVSRKALRRLPGQAEPLEEFRLLYQRARYRGEATREDLQRAKRLCSQLKKEL